MGDFLTASATLTCPHGGTVTAAPSDTHVTYGKDPVVLKSDTFTVAGCPFMLGSSPHPCATVEWTVAAAKSAATGTAALTTDSVGLCKAADGAVQGPVTIQAAAQAKAGGQ
jgi:hypothetical protein